ncbi:MAG: sensor histidine kinase, partial [Nitrococcus sp.]|nr:sensor histidine kinase [Nitrococcus sp.]
VVTFNDITALKQEQQRYRDAYKELQSVTLKLVFAEELAQKKLAADLHGSLAQILSLAKVKLGELQPAIQNEQSRQQIQQITELVGQANAAVRSHIFELHPPVLDDFGLLKALEWLVEAMRQRFGLEVRFKRDGLPPALDEQLRSTLFRAARELLINVAKHASVEQATLSLAYGERTLRLTVADRGQGFDPAQIERDWGRGFGLFSIRERLGYFGGEIKIVSARGKGTRVTLTAPLTPAARE